MCDCEAGLDRHVGPGGDESFVTPDGRPGAIVQFHLPRFRKDRVPALEWTLLARLSQNVLTAPTASCFNLLDTPEFYKLGRKIAFFGDGHQFRDTRHGRLVWVVPILSGEFVIDRRFGYRDGLMGGNLWFLGATADAVLDACAAGGLGRGERARRDFAFSRWRGGQWFKGRQPLLVRRRQHLRGVLPDLAREVGAASRVPPEVVSIQEIIINGHDLPTIVAATRAAIAASMNTAGLVSISAGNYGGRLGKSFVDLHPDKQPAGG